MTHPDASDEAVTDASPPASADATSQRTGRLRRRWPVPAGLGFAAVVAFGMTSGVELAVVLTAAAVVYLGSAALGTRRAAWLLFVATTVVITVARVLDDRFEPMWILLGGGVLAVIYGLVRGALRPPGGLPLQTLALLGFGAVATVALWVDPVLGSYLVAVGLLGHAGWDLYHHRAHKVVARSFAEFCLALDATLAVVIVLVTVTA